LAAGGGRLELAEKTKLEGETDVRENSYRSSETISFLHENIEPLDKRICREKANGGLLKKRGVAGRKKKHTPSGGGYLFHAPGSPP